MNTNPFRPGSRKASIYSTFQSDGVDAAVKLGKELGLASTSVAGWLRQWSNGTAQQNSPPTQRGMKGRQRVTVKYWPEAVAYLIEKGPEVSEIYWHGRYQGISNDNLEFEEDPK